jgi:hypothetical protein
MAALRRTFCHDYADFIALPELFLRFFDCSGAAPSAALKNKIAASPETGFDRL